MQCNANVFADLSRVARENTSPSETTLLGNRKDRTFSRDLIELWKMLGVANYVMNATGASGTFGMNSAEYNGARIFLSLSS